MTLYTLFDGARYARFEGQTHDTYREYQTGDAVDLSLDEVEQFAPGRIVLATLTTPAMSADSLEKTETELRREIESEKPVFRTTIKPQTEEPKEKKSPDNSGVKIRVDEKE